MKYDPGVPRASGVFLIPLLFVASFGCGRGQQTGPLDITLREPSAPRAGENTFEARVLQEGQPVTDAEVSVELYMAAMPSMNMPEMRNTVTLEHQGDGWYRGTGSVMMAGPWDATVTVTRNGQRVGDRKVPLVAK